MLRLSANDLPLIILGSRRVVGDLVTETTLIPSRCRLGADYCRQVFEGITLHISTEIR